MSKATKEQAKEFSKLLASDVDNEEIVNKLSQLGFKLENNDYSALKELREFLNDRRTLSEKRNRLSRSLVVELCKFSDEIYKEVFDGKVGPKSFKPFGTRLEFQIMEAKFLKTELDQIANHKKPIIVFNNRSMINKIEYLLEEVKKNYNIQYVCFYKCDIDDNTSIKIAKFINTAENIDCRFIGGNISDTLFEKLERGQHISLEWLKIGQVISIHININSEQYLIKKINDSKNKQFCFTKRNPITEKTLEFIEKNISISSLRFRECDIDNKKAIQIANLIGKNQNIIEVDLSNNQIGDRGASALATAIEKNQNITCIALSNNQIGDRGASALATAIEKNQNITCILLSDNQIGDRGASALATAIEKNQNITCILLSDNQIGDKGLEELKKVLLQHHSIEYVFGVPVSKDLQGVLDFNRNKDKYNLKYKAESIIEVLSKNFAEDKDIKNQQKLLDAADKSFILDLMQNPSRLDILMDQKVMGFEIKGKLPSRKIFSKEELVKAKQNLEEKAGKIKKSLGIVENPIATTVELEKSNAPW